MKSTLLALLGAALLALSACGDLPPGTVPLQSTAERGGGDVRFNPQRGVGY